MVPDMVKSWVSCKKGEPIQLMALPEKTYFVFRKQFAMMAGLTPIFVRLNDQFTLNLSTLEIGNIFDYKYEEVLPIEQIEISAQVNLGVDVNS